MKPIEILLHLFEVGGFWGMVAGLIVLGICIGSYEIAKYFVIRYLEYKFPSFAARNSRRISQSTFFDKMNILVLYKIPRMTIPCPLRSRIFRKILTLCFTTWRNRVQQKILEKNVSKLSSEEFINFWHTFIYKTTDVWEEEATKVGVPEVALRKYREKHSKSLQLMVNMVDQICLSATIYRSNIEKTLAILDFIAILLDMSLLDAEQTIMEINGELSKVTYEGVACEKCEVECNHKPEINEGE